MYLQATFWPLPGRNRGTRRAARSLRTLPLDLGLDLVIRRLGAACTARDVREAYAVGLMLLHPELAGEGRAAA